jgi:hypothetical protein
MSARKAKGHPIVDGPAQYVRLRLRAVEPVLERHHQRHIALNFDRTVSLRGGNHSTCLMPPHSQTLSRPGESSGLRRRVDGASARMSGASARARWTDCFLAGARADASRCADASLLGATPPRVALYCQPCHQPPTSASIPSKRASGAPIAYRISERSDTECAAAGLDTPSPRGGFRFFLMGHSSRPEGADTCGEPHKRARDTGATHVWRRALKSQLPCVVKSI